MIATEPTTGQMAPTSVVILGAAGDLTRRKLLPALYNLFRDELLPDPFSVVGFARRDMDDDSFRDLTRKSLNDYSRREVQADHWEQFLGNVHYVRGSFGDHDAFAALAARGSQGNAGQSGFLSLDPAERDSELYRRAGFCRVGEFA